MIQLRLARLESDLALGDSSFAFAGGTGPRRNTTDAGRCSAGTTLAGRSAEITSSRRNSLYCRHHLCLWPRPNASRRELFPLQSLAAASKRSQVAF